MRLNPNETSRTWPWGTDLFIWVPPVDRGDSWNSSFISVDEHIQYTTTELIQRDDPRAATLWLPVGITSCQSMTLSSTMRWIPTMSNQSSTVKTVCWTLAHRAATTLPASLTWNLIRTEPPVTILTPVLVIILIPDRICNLEPGQTVVQNPVLTLVMTTEVTSQTYSLLKGKVPPTLQRNQNHGHNPAAVVGPGKQRIKNDVTYHPRKISPIQTNQIGRKRNRSLARKRLPLRAIPSRLTSHSLQGTK